MKKEEELADNRKPKWYMRLSNEDKFSRAFTCACRQLAKCMTAKQNNMRVAFFMQGASNEYLTNYCSTIFSQTFAKRKQPVNHRQSQ